MRSVKLASLAAVRSGRGIPPDIAVLRVRPRLHGGEAAAATLAPAVLYVVKSYRKLRRNEPLAIARSDASRRPPNAGNGDAYANAA